METKKFKPFEKVLVRDAELVWQPDLYGFWDKTRDNHITVINAYISDDDILPYEGNEELLGTSKDPEEEVRLEEGECLLAVQGLEKAKKNIGNPGCYTVVLYKNIYKYSDDIFRIEDNKGCFWEYVVKFSDFNPNNMEETKKHILCVKNGKIIRYKG